MNTYTVTNKFFGTTVGTFQASNRAELLDKVAQHTGQDSWQAMAALMGTDNPADFGLLIEMEG